MFGFGTRPVQALSATTRATGDKHRENIVGQGSTDGCAVNLSRTPCLARRSSPHAKRGAAGTALNKTGGL